MMKALVAIFIFLFACYHGTAQSYNDPILGRAAGKEVELLTKLTRRFQEGQRIFTPMQLHAGEEFLANSKSINSIDLILPTIPVNLCNNFLLPTSSKAIKCRAKRDYLTSVALTARSIANFNFTGRMTEGEKKQIIEKYTSIINEVNYQFEQMSIESKKRTRLFNSGFLN